MKIGNYSLSHESCFDSGAFALRFTNLTKEKERTTLNCPNCFKTETRLVAAFFYLLRRYATGPRIHRIESKSVDIKKPFSSIHIIHIFSSGKSIGLKIIKNKSSFCVPIQRFSSIREKCQSSYFYFNFILFNSENFALFRAQILDIAEWGN